MRRTLLIVLAFLTALAGAPAAAQEVGDPPPQALETVLPDVCSATDRRPPGELPVEGRASQFIPLSPQRLLDTRSDTEHGFLCPGASMELQVLGEADVPVFGVTAVVLNITVTETAGAGYLTVWPTAGPRPATSTLNATGAGQTIPNLAIVPIGPDGKISFFSQTGSHVLVDVFGYFSSVDDATAFGRLFPLSPRRIHDTRTPAAPLVAEETRTFPVAGSGGVPVVGASAVALNVTATNAHGPGFVSVWPTGDPQPATSVINVPAPGATASNLVIVPLGEDGSVEVYSQAGADIAIDVSGFFTDSSGSVATAGLFIAVDPTRVFDSRPDESALGAKGYLDADSAVTAQIHGFGVPDEAHAILLNLTGTEAAEAGYVTAWPADEPRPNSSSLNLGDGDTRPNASIVKLSDSGSIALYSQSGAHVIADTSGYFLGP